MRRRLTRAGCDGGSGERSAQPGRGDDDDHRKNPAPEGRFIGKREHRWDSQRRLQNPEADRVANRIAARDPCGDVSSGGDANQAVGERDQPNR